MPRVKEADRKQRRHNYPARKAMNNKLPREQEPAVIAAYESAPCREVGKQFGISHQAVLDVVRKNGGAVFGRSRKTGHRGVAQPGRATDS